MGEVGRRHATLHDMLPARAQLDVVDRHIAALRHDLEEQRERIAVLKADGSNVAEAEELLEQAEQALLELVGLRDLIVRALPE